MPKKFTGARLRLARHFRGFTQAELGKIVQVSHQFVGYTESGQREPSEVVVAAFGEALAFEADFFYLPPSEELLDEECNFRRRQTTPLAARSQALAHAALFGELVAYLETQLHLPAQKIPTVRVRDAEEIERAADRCRMEWGLGLDLPIKNVVRVVENSGVPITRFGEISHKVDAFSRRGKRSVVVLNDKTPSRSRWDVAHEWGHLVMHADSGSPTDDLEREADRFAGAFLLPRAGFVREFPLVRKWNWETMFRLKERWRVSLAAIIRRAFDLRLIDAIQYRRAYKYMSMSAWLKHEPHEFNGEEPELVRVAFAELEKSFGIRPLNAAQALLWRPSTLRSISGIDIGQDRPTAPSARTNIVNLSAVQGRSRRVTRRHL
jgi:Zn-dependent peptidase ImmA (M78 family)/DNA-binding XRE family transcriptional regulator